MASKKKPKKDFSEFETFEEDDITNSEDEYSEGERELLEKVRKKRVAENFDSEDEVYGLQGEDDDADSMESDIERPQEDDDMPDERAWGKQKRTYYSTDYVDQDYATTNEKDMVQAELEEKEARNIQQRLAEQMDDADFGLDIIPTDIAAKSEGEEVIKTDLSKLSKRQRLALLQKESPELQPLVDDFKERLRTIKKILAPFLQLAKEENLPDCPAINFIKTQYELTLNYCVNINFYLMLKAKKILVANHPVIKRLAQYRQLLGQLEEGQGKLLAEVAEILEAKQNGKTVYNVINKSEMVTDKPQIKAGEKRKLSISESVEHDEEDMEEDHSDVDEDNEGIDEELTQEQALGEEKRPINYQIAKNKGLTPHRKKEQRNPRVKHRNKYRKAKIRRKGAVREVRKELTRYSGEMSGIKAGIKKSIKIK